MEQLSLFDDVALFNNYGFTVENTFHPSNDPKFNKLENTQKVSYNGKTILHLQDNGNGTFNTFSFNEMNFNITLDKVFRIANVIVRERGYNLSINKGLFTSNTDLWETPQDFFNRLNKEFNFELDVCATDENAKCEKYFTEETDGLKQEWKGVCWMNPPYGRQIGKWIKKAYESSLNGATVVCLLPARTDTRWWHDYCMKGEIRLVKGRLKFGDSKNSAPFPSAVVVFGKQAQINKLKAM